MANNTLLATTFNPKEYIYVTGKDIFISRKSPTYTAMLNSIYSYNKEIDALVPLTLVDNSNKIELKPSIWSNLYAIKDILLLVLSYCDGKTLTSCSTSNKYLRRLVLLQPTQWVKSVVRERYLHVAANVVKKWEETKLGDIPTGQSLEAINYIRTPRIIPKWLDTAIKNNFTKLCNDEMPIEVATILYPIVLAGNCQEASTHLYYLAMYCPKVMRKYCAIKLDGIHNALCGILTHQKTYRMVDICTICILLQPYLAHTTKADADIVDWHLIYNTPLDCRGNPIVIDMATTFYVDTPDDVCLKLQCNSDVLGLVEKWKPRDV